LTVTPWIPRRAYAAPPVGELRWRPPVEPAATGNPNRPGDPDWPRFMIPGDDHVENGGTTPARVGLHADRCDMVEPWLERD